MATTFAEKRNLGFGAAALFSTAALCAAVLLAPNLWNKTRAFLTLKLQSRFARSTPSDAITGIIALGGSHARIVEAVHLAKQYPNAKLIITGAPAEDQDYAQAQIADGRLTIEPYAKTTYENALFSRQLLEPDQRQSWLIVTSAIHMPRAVGAFREAGFSVLPWPVFDQPAIDTAATQVTLHEVFGLLDYWALGRIDCLFPAPNS
jgi:uncharacterized SAM-binding protein YcdF (DUF218 family)